MKNITIVLPSLNPDEKLEKVVEALVDKGFEDIVVVNDGSDEKHLVPFEKIKAYPQCTVLVHEVNKGKGRALKTAFEYCLQNRKDILGVVTVDGDNQHRADDIYMCAQEMIKEQDKIILGVRDFSQKDVPLKSCLGNRITSFVFKIACGLNISDTQTGLRAIPYCHLDKMVQINGERFEYETNMLLEMGKYDIGFKEVKITTVYIEENATSHFNPLRDSIKIYAVIMKFLCSSIMASIVDLSAFSIANNLIGDILPKVTRIFCSTVIARIISSFINFYINQKAVFKSKEKINKTIIRYYIVCVLQTMASFLLVHLFTDLLDVSTWVDTVVKVFVDVFLFIISFNIQRSWVFKKDRQ